MHSSDSSEKEENSDSEEEELDLEKLKAKMMDDFILPSSPAVKVKTETNSESKAAIRSAGELSGSDIDSDQDYDTFPLWYVIMLSRGV